MSDSILEEEKADNTQNQDTPEKQDVPAGEAASVAPESEETPPPAPVATAPRCENPIIGRKVFFVNPPLYVENYLHLELRQEEYEVYIISDYRYTKAALRHFPDALCFIFIDDELSYDEWFNFIKSFQEDSVLKTIFVGLMSAVIPKTVFEKFMINLSLPGGFIMLNEFKGSALIEKIVGILDLNGAKGRRKYLRLDCDENITINGYFADKSQLYQVSIANISSVGFSCIYPKAYGSLLAKNCFVPSFSITLGRRSIVTPSVVLDTKVVDANRLFSILLFVKQVGQDDRKVIKNFIFDQLQERFENIVFSATPDVEDYSNRNPKFSKTAAVAAAPAGETEAAVDSESVSDEVEEAEELSDAEPVENAEPVEKNESSDKEAPDQKPESESKPEPEPEPEAEKTAGSGSAS